MLKLDLEKEEEKKRGGVEKEEEPKIKLPISVGS